MKAYKVELKDMEMNENKREKLHNIIGWAIAILPFVIAIAIVIFNTWLFYTYGNTPVAELPTWVWWFLNH